jgi:flagellin-like hook-associated protein FlgL
MGGRDQEMTFGIGRINYGALYGTGTSERTIEQAITTGTAVDGPNKGAKFNLAHLPSDAVVAKELGKAAGTGLAAANKMAAGKTYVIEVVAVAAQDAYQTGGESAGKIRADASAVFRAANSDGVGIVTGNMLAGDVIVMNTEAEAADINAAVRFKEVNATDNAFLKGHEYEVVSMGTSDGATGTALSDAAAILNATSATAATLAQGTKFTVDADASVAEMAALNALTSGMTFRMSSDTLTKDIEAMQGLVNTARVQAGSQYAALESAVNYTTDLTAQYELGYNTVNDVNFSMETAHLAKNQILQQAATAMLAQANQGQQGLLQLIS